MTVSSVAWSTFLWTSWSIAIAWMLHAIAVLRGMATLADLTRMHIGALPELEAGEGPQITVVVPACNEEASIHETLRSLLATSGVRLEIVAVNDRSRDGTGERIEEVVREASGGGPHVIKVIHISELPDGWLGKPHALARGAELGTAKWLLFTDADVRFEATALEKALRYAESVKADHLILPPTLILRSVGEAAMLAVMQTMAQWGIRLWKIDDPRERDSLGVGAFNLLRRDVFEKIGGMERLRLAVVEDLRLGFLVKRGGFRQRAVLGPGLVRIRWIEGTLGVIGLIEKNGFAVFQYRTWVALLVAFGFALDVVIPLAAMAAGGWVMAAGVVSYAGIFLCYWANRRIMQASPWLAVLFAPALVILIFAQLRSVVLTLGRGGVRWRGTLYPLRQLRRFAQGS